MRIAYITADFGIPVHGNKGASIHVRELSQALLDEGHDVQVFTPRQGGDAPADYQVPVHELRPDRADKRTIATLQEDPAASEVMAKEIRGLLYATSMRHRLLEHFRTWRPDAIYERYSLLATAGVELAHELGIPHILEVNAPLSKEAAEHRGVAFQHTIESIERRIINATSQVVAVSEPIRHWAQSLGVQHDRTTVMANGVNINRFSQSASSAGSTLIPRDKPVVGFVGTLKAWHGTPMLIQAIGYIARVRGKNHAPRLLIVGDGPQRETLEGLSAEEGISDLTVFTGSVPHHEIPAWISQMDVAVAPYDELQNFYFSPLKVYEYMAAGKAIVASNIGQITDCLSDGINGLLYQPGSVTSLATKITQLLDNDGLRNSLESNARASAVADHSWSRNAQSVTELIHHHQSESRPNVDLVSLGGIS